MFIENHTTALVGGDLEDHLVPTPLPWAGTTPTSLGCPGPHPACP